MVALALTPSVRLGLKPPAMSLKQNKHLTKEMNEALDILVGMDTTSVFENDDISLEFLKEQELDEQSSP